MEKKAQGWEITILNPWRKTEILQKVFLSEVKDNKNSIRIPVGKISVHSLDNIGFLSELNLIEKVSSVTDADRIYNLEILQRIKSGSVIDLGPAISLNIEKLALSQPDVILTTTYGNDQNINALEDLGFSYIYNIGWMEPTPLGRAEWIKLIGVLAGQTQKAIDVFEHIETEYLKTKDMVSNIGMKPRVFFGAPYKEVWYMPGGKSYKAIILKDAGADYEWFSSNQTGSIPLSLEMVLAKHYNDDIWLESPFRTFEELQNNDSRFAGFRSVKQANVFNTFGRSSAVANDYWETGVCRPDIVLKDMVSIIHPDLISHEIYYYKTLEVHE